MTEKGKNKGNNMHVLYVDANAITKSTGSSSSSSAPSSGSPAASTSNYTAYADANSKDSIEFDVRDYYAIKEIAAEPSLFKLLVHSLCPSIFGHEVVKGRRVCSKAWFELDLFNMLSLFKPVYYLHFLVAASAITMRMHRKAFRSAVIAMC